MTLRTVPYSSHGIYSHVARGHVPPLHASLHRQEVPFLLSPVSQAFTLQNPSATWFNLRADKGWHVGMSLDAGIHNEDSILSQRLSGGAELGVSKSFSSPRDSYDHSAQGYVKIDDHAYEGQQNSSGKFFEVGGRYQGVKVNRDCPFSSSNVGDGFSVGASYSKRRIDDIHGTLESSFLPDGSDTYHLLAFSHRVFNGTYNQYTGNGLDDGHTLYAIAGDDFESQLTEEGHREVIADNADFFGGDYTFMNDDLAQSTRPEWPDNTIEMDVINDQRRLASVELYVAGLEQTTFNVNAAYSKSLSPRLQAIARADVDVISLTVRVGVRAQSHNTHLQAPILHFYLEDYLKDELNSPIAAPFYDERVVETVTANNGTEITVTNGTLPHNSRINDAYRIDTPDGMGGINYAVDYEAYDAAVADAFAQGVLQRYGHTHAPAKQRYVISSFETGLNYTHKAFSVFGGTKAGFVHQNDAGNAPFAEVRAGGSVRITPFFNVSGTVRHDLIPLQAPERSDAWDAGTQVNVRATLTLPLK